VCGCFKSRKVGGCEWSSPPALDKPHAPALAWLRKLGPSGTALDGPSNTASRHRGCEWRPQGQGHASSVSRSGATIHIHQPAVRRTACERKVENQRIDRCKRIGPMPVTIAALLALSLFSACGIIMIGEAVKHQDLGSVDESEENLKAIRAMLVDHASPASEETLSVPSTQPLPADPTPSLSESSSSGRPAPLASPSAGRTDLPAKLPWTPSSADRLTAPDRSVPAYTVPAPVGPDYSGSIRCAPDGMGGQRCVGR